MVMRARKGFLLIEAVVGTIVLGIALAVIVGLAGRSIGAQREGESLQIAAMLADEQLSNILVFGVDQYSSRFRTRGQCEAPYANYAFELKFTGGQGLEPYRVTCTISWTSGRTPRSIAVETLMSPQRGEDPERRPEEVISRDTV